MLRKRKLVPFLTLKGGTKLKAPRERNNPSDATALAAVGTLKGHVMCRRSLLWKMEIRSCLPLQQNTSANFCGRSVALAPYFVRGCYPLAPSPLDTA
jgi:hypothetical protein